MVFDAPYGTHQPRKQVVLELYPNRVFPGCIKLLLQFLSVLFQGLAIALKDSRILSSKEMRET